MTIQYCSCGALMNTTSDGRATCPSCGASTKMPTYPREKSLVDEFAKAAMEGLLANPEPIGMDTIEECYYKIASLSYGYAAAMMAEREKRDEMGRLKESDK